MRAPPPPPPPHPLSVHAPIPAHVAHRSSYPVEAAQRYWRLLRAVCDAFRGRCRGQWSWASENALGQCLLLLQDTNTYFALLDRLQHADGPREAREVLGAVLVWFRSDTCWCVFMRDSAWDAPCALGPGVGGGGIWGINAIRECRIDWGYGWLGLWTMASGCVARHAPATLSQANSPHPLRHTLFCPGTYPSRTFTCCETSWCMSVVG